MLRIVPANRATTEDPAQLLGDLSIGRSFRIVHMYSTVLFKESPSVTYSAAAFPDQDEDIQIERSMDPDAICCAVGSNRTAKTSPE